MIAFVIVALSLMVTFHDAAVVFQEGNIGAFPINAHHVLATKSATSHGYVLVPPLMAPISAVPVPGW